MSNVTNMEYMFYGASSFNQPLEKWDVSNVTDMGYMFYGARSFNQPLERWNVSNVTDMGYMFHGAKRSTTCLQMIVIAVMMVRGDNLLHLQYHFLLPHLLHSVRLSLGAIWNIHQIQW